MGYTGKLVEKIKAQELRKQGLSYGEIRQKVDVSKDTLSRWCKDIILSENQKRRLIQNRSFGQKKGSIIAADNKRQARILKTQIIFKEAKEEIGNVSKRDQFIAGIMLYAGEGIKGDGNSGFANSDPNLILFMMNWFKETCNIPTSKFRGAIWIHQGLNEEKAKTFWSELTGIPKHQFHKTYIAKDKKDSKKIRKNIHPYGIFAIRFSDSNKQRRIMGWISALVGDRIPKVH